MKFDVKNRFTYDVKFTAEIDCEEATPISIKIGMAVKWAYAKEIDLGGADLRGANLGGANLGGANLGGAYLGDADLRGANLRDADLRDANLGDANLGGADLGDADLRGAYLRGANLGGANLGGANLGGADLRSFKHDLWGILIRFLNEVPELINYIKQGKIDGSCYSGECSCLMGTFATIKNCDVNSEDFSIRDHRSPAETWFFMIRPGDTPENSFASKMALEWIEEFMGYLNGYGK